MRQLQRCFVSVHAMTRVDGQWQFASGGTSGARKEVALQQFRTVRYRVVAKKRWGGLRRGGHDIVLEVDAQTRLPELVLVAKAGGIPLHPKNGTEVLRIPAGMELDPNRPLKQSFLADGLPRHWKARLFPVDDKHCDWLDLDCGS